jgi:hypothetical protein
MWGGFSVAALTRLAARPSHPEGREIGSDGVRMTASNRSQGRIICSQLQLSFIAKVAEWFGPPASATASASPAL